jgi:hypothetical protein
MTGNEPVIVLITGNGPTDTVYENPADDPTTGQPEVGWGGRSLSVATDFVEHRSRGHVSRIRRSRIFLCDQREPSTGCSPHAMREYLPT